MRNRVAGSNRPEVLDLAGPCQTGSNMINTSSMSLTEFVIPDDTVSASYCAGVASHCAGFRVVFLVRLFQVLAFGGFLRVVFFGFCVVASSVVFLSSSSCD